MLKKLMVMATCLGAINLAAPVQAAHAPPNVMNAPCGPNTLMRLMQQMNSFYQRQGMWPPLRIDFQTIYEAQQICFQVGDPRRAVMIEAGR